VNLRKRELGGMNHLCFTSKKKMGVKETIRETLGDGIEIKDNGE